jgi:methylthioribose-1-phosphate isomerase
MSEVLTTAIHWHGDRLELLDQRHLPDTESWWSVTTAEDTAEAIGAMAVRGAPAIGITAAYGLVLAARQQGASATRESLQPRLQKLAASRPTAVNLRHALERLDAVMAEHEGAELTSKLEDEAMALHAEDLERNRRLAEHGAMLFTNRVRIYTHCNTGGLATGGHGTALGIVRTAHEKGILQHVYAGETRPWLQGSRLTMWELLRDSIPASLVIDSCAGDLMRRQAVDAVVVGADRVTANGDVANKIGTYSLAVLAHQHGLPFIVAAPCATLDPDTVTGADITIEERDPAEVTAPSGQPMAPADCPVANPAFDITPASLVTAIVTEDGIIAHPEGGDIAAHLRRARASRSGLDTAS